MDKIQAQEFLKSLVKKIKESDKKEKHDKKPMLFFIQEKIKLETSDGCGDGCWYLNRDDCELIFDTKEELEAFLEKNKEYSEDDFDEVELQEMWQTKELAFLTRESAQDHINANYYHYNQPKTCSKGVWRDPLIEGLFKALHVLYGEN